MDNQIEEHQIEKSLLEFSNETLQKLFSYMNDVELLDMSQVCKRFRDNAKQAWKLKHNRYFSMKANISGSFGMYTPLIERFGEETTALSIDLCNVVSEMDIDDTIMRFIKEKYPSMECLILKNDSLDPRIIFDYFQDLTSLSLVNIISSNSSWTGLTYPHLLSFCTDSSTSNQPGDVRRFLENNQQLQHIALKDLENENNTWTTLHLPHLTTLCINNLENVTAEAIDEFVQGNRQLRVLNIINCTSLSPNDTIKRLTKRLNQFTLLKIIRMTSDPYNTCIIRF